MTKNNRGRPKLSQTEKTVAITVTITESQAEFLKVCGDGSRSQGVRNLVNAKTTLFLKDRHIGLEFDPEYARIAWERIRESHAD